MEILNYPEICGQCSERAKCAERYASGWMVVTIHAKPLRLSQLRRAQDSEQFKAKYRRRSWIEPTNSILKRTTGSVLGMMRIDAWHHLIQQGKSSPAGRLMEILGLYPVRREIQTASPSIRSPCRVALD